MIRVMFLNQDSPEEWLKKVIASTTKNIVMSSEVRIKEVLEIDMTDEEFKNLLTEEQQYINDILKYGPHS